MTNRELIQTAMPLSSLTEEEWNLLNKQPDNKLHDRWIVSLYHEVKNGHDLRSRTGYGDFHLNYCPECGKKLSGRSKNNDRSVQ